jgi:putative cell wall-binding protein
MRHVRLLLVPLLAVALLAPAAPARAEVRIERQAGPDRIATAVEVTRAGWPSAPRALLATASGFPDALAAGALAASLDAPLLLTRPDDLPEAVADELVRLEVEEVVILGGPGAVSDAVFVEVQELASRPGVRRIGGADRFATAAAVAAEAGAPAGEAVVVSGTTFPDAVSAGALTATANRPPVLLTQRDALPAATREALLALDVTRVTVIGGGAAVDETVLDELRALDLDVVRLAGDSRFTTSVAVAEEAMRRFRGEVPVVFATGGDFPDALAAGALAARRIGPVILVPADGPGQRLDAFLRARTRRWTQATVVGGTAAVSDLGLDGLRRAVNDLAPAGLVEGRAVIAEWFEALDANRFGALRARSTGIAEVYADYVGRADAVTEVVASEHRIVREPTTATPLGDGAFRLDMVVELLIEGDAPVPVTSFTVRQLADGTFAVADFLRADRPLGEFVLDGADLGTDYGDVVVQGIRWFRNAARDEPEVFLLAQIVNRRDETVAVDDLMAGLTTRADGASYVANLGRFPEIPANSARDVVISWLDVARSDGGGDASFMIYGGGDPEFETLAEVVLPTWPRG